MDDKSILERLTAMERNTIAALDRCEWRVGSDEPAAILHEHTMRVAREVWTDGVNHLSDGSPVRLYPEPAFYEQTGMVARHRFPLPPKRVPREEPDPHKPNVVWRVNADVLQLQRWDRTGWSFAPTDVPTPERVALWADLLANPYREEPQ